MGEPTTKPLQLHRHYMQKVGRGRAARNPPQTLDLDAWQAQIRKLAASKEAASFALLVRSSTERNYV
jgi:hypothetical protein